MIKKIFCITLFSLLTFTLNVNSAEIKCDSVIISSPDIKGDEDCKKKRFQQKMQKLNLMMDRYTKDQLKKIRLMVTEN